MKNLVLVAQDYWSDPNDLREIAQEVARGASDIGVFVVLPRDPPKAMPAIPWDRPTLTVGFGRLGNFNPARGRVFHNKKIDKLDEYARFRLAGIDTPLTERFEFGKHYDPAVWGELAVLKPLSQKMASKGGNNHLIRTSRLHQLSPSTLAPDHFLSKGPALVQQFIDTGKYPTSWRILTLFGEALYSMKRWSPIERPDLDADDAAIESAIIDHLHPKLKKLFAELERKAFVRDDEICAFARRIYGAFPGIPLQGCDILRRESDGKLFALEINAGGNTWHFSSKAQEKERETLGGKAAFAGQFGAWKIAADTLIARTRAQAS